jgi:adenylate cyclase
VGGFRDDLLDWASGEGTGCKSVPLLLDSYCRFLNSQHFGIRRCNLATETVHPLMHNTRHVWFDRATDPGPINPAVVVERRQYDLATSMIDEVYFNSGSQRNPQFLASPFFVIEEKGELHAAIRPPGEHQPFPVFNDLADLGCTDYFGSVLKNFSGMLQKIGLATDRLGGFGGGGINELRESLRVLTLLLNTVVESNTKHTLARVYVGRDAGRRVCEGMIHRGEVVSIEAAIWFSDLRGFTATGEGLEPEQLIERLNDYFEIVAGAIHAAGGEVLKYIGDAVLAIFPVSDERGRVEACRAAVSALRDAEERLAALNERVAEAGEGQVAHGVGLHIGTASYGNIGGRQRLDFTVIGRAVNIASRIEGQCRPNGVAALCSEEFRDLAGLPEQSLGPFDLKGVAGQIELHAIEPAATKSPPVSVPCPLSPA